MATPADTPTITSKQLAKFIMDMLERHGVELEEDGEETTVDFDAEFFSSTVIRLTFEDGRSFLVSVKYDNAV